MFHVELWGKDNDREVDKKAFRGSARGQKKEMSKHIGSSLNEFLEEEGLLAHTEEVARKRVVENYRALGRPFNGRTFLIRKTPQEVEEILEALNRFLEKEHVIN